MDPNTRGKIGEKATDLKTQANDAQGEGGAAKGTTVSCLCGKCVISFKDRTPIARAHCCCVDCYQKMDWAKSQGWIGDLPKGPSENFYIQNSITNIKGRELLKPYYLRKPADPTAGGSVFTVADCCKSVMTIDHPFYFGMWVMVMSQSCKLDTGEIPFTMKSFPKDYDAAVRGPLPDQKYEVGDTPEEQEAAFNGFCAVAQAGTAEGCEGQQVYNQNPVSLDLKEGEYICDPSLNKSE